MSVDPVLLIVIPLIAAFLTPLTSLFSKKLARFVPILGLIGMGTIMAILFNDLYDGPVTSTTGGFDPPYGISIIMTPLGGIVATGMIFVALFVILSNIGTRYRGSSSLYNSMIMMATTGAIGMVITGDLFNMFVFLEITSIAGVVLAAMPRDGDSRGLNWRGAAVYAVVGAVASFMVLAGIALLYGSTSTLNIAQMADRMGEVDSFVAGTAFLAMLIGFGIEAEFFPLNGWAPEVYRGSSWGTSSIFSGVIGKAGLIALIRIAFVVIGPSMEGTVTADILLWGGVATFLFGEAAAFTSKDLYRMLGYSSIGVFGLLTASFALGSEDGIRAAMMLLIGHMLAKPILFSVASHLEVDGDIPLRSLKGLMKISPTAGLLMTAGALAMIGMPPSPTFWGKFLFFSGSGDNWAVIALVALGTILEAGYIGRIIYNIHAPNEKARKRSLPLARGLMGVIAVMVIIVIGVFPGAFDGILGLVVDELLDPSTYSGWGVI